jgi:polyisoprenoid-binding protein YceI
VLDITFRCFSPLTSSNVLTMALGVGRYALEGRLTLRTSRDGLAAQAGHDLTIDIGTWSGGLVIGEDLGPASLDVRVELGSLVVRAGTGGIKPLSDRDKREIIATARKVLSVDRYPEATFTATTFSPADDGGTIDGTLTLAGQSGPLRLQVRQAAPDRYLATTTVRHTSFGIKPYSGFLGALKVSDEVAVEVEAGITLTSG